jgi:hypothetical protein
MNRLTRSAMLFIALSMVLSLICAASLSAQTRLSDQDVQQHMKNLKDDAKKFRSRFNSALSKSTIRKTTREKDATTLARNFEKQTKFHARDLQEKHQGGTVPAELPGHRAADGQNHDEHAAGLHHRYAVVHGEDRTQYANAFHVPGV